MDSYGPLGWVALALVTYLPPLLAIVAARGLSHCLADKPSPAGNRLRALAALGAALLVPLFPALIAVEATGLVEPGFQFLLAAVALASPMLIALVADAAYTASERSGGPLHRIAAWPFWSLAVCLAGLVALGGHSLEGFVFLAVPALLLAVVVFDRAAAMTRAKSRSNTEVLAFIAPTAGLESCAVCQEPVRNRRATCTSCRAVQHRECWEFIGHCGAAGCLCQRVS